MPVQNRHARYIYALENDLFKTHFSVKSLTLNLVVFNQILTPIIYKALDYIL